MQILGFSSLAFLKIAWKIARKLCKSADLDISFLAFGDCDDWPNKSVEASGSSL